MTLRHQMWLWSFENLKVELWVRFTGQNDGGSSQCQSNTVRAKVYENIDQWRMHWGTDKQDVIEWDASRGFAEASKSALIFVILGSLRTTWTGKYLSGFSKSTCGTGSACLLTKYSSMTFSTSANSPLASFQKRRIYVQLVFLTRPCSFVDMGCVGRGTKNLPSESQKMWASKWLRMVRSSVLLAIPISLLPIIAVVDRLRCVRRRDMR